MNDRERATRATLHFLAGGSPLADALRAASNAAESTPVRASFRAAADDLGTDTFRRDVLARIGLEPPVVAVLLARAPRDALPEVAESILAAISRPLARHREWVIALYLGGVALLELVTAASLSQAAMLDAASPFWMPAMILAAIALFTVSAGVWIAERRLELGVAQIVFWLVAGERAHVPPAAVLEALRGSVSLHARLAISRLIDRARGAASVSDALTLWAEKGGLRGPLARLVGLVAEGETAAAAAARVGRIAAAIEPPRGSFAAPVVVAGIGLILSAALIAAGALGATLGVG